MNDREFEVVQEGVRILGEILEKLEEIRCGIVDVETEVQRLRKEVIVSDS